MARRIHVVRYGTHVLLSFRVNDNDGPAHGLATRCSVFKDNFLAFGNDWQTRWANEVALPWEK